MTRFMFAGALALAALLGSQREARAHAGLTEFLGSHEGSGRSASFQLTPEERREIRRDYNRNFRSLSSSEKREVRECVRDEHARLRSEYASDRREQRRDYEQQYRELRREYRLSRDRDERREIRAEISALRRDYQQDSRERRVQYEDDRLLAYQECICPFL